MGFLFERLLYMSCRLESKFPKEGYIGDYIGDNYRGY